MSNDLFNMLGDDNEAPETDLQNDFQPQDLNLNDNQALNADQEGGIDQMLAGGDDDDDLFGGPSQNPNDQAPEPEQQTALVEWERKRQEEIQKIDAELSAQDEELRKQASASLDKYYKGLKESQEKRAQCNIETDQQFLSTQSNTDIPTWERVVGYIDFNRSDLHERDASRMKSLLLQLKH
ncbi:Clathrin light chain [Tritrichomonas foetus]|uniref:Clathrin light chain n=1 Tax=Tritrichomonas foetus TaxID=1144522 RepID=A0A1J4JXL6_9EUKA|nr:Clathrin light chain [Tritrichomonas foetus]|eukprot:OHT03418.1 Clathrin light chain [Tritrichomonas foetus]